MSTITISDLDEYLALEVLEFLKEKGVPDSNVTVIDASPSEPVGTIDSVVSPPVGFCWEG